MKAELIKTYESEGNVLELYKHKEIIIDDQYGVSLNDKEYFFNDYSNAVITFNAVRNFLIYDLHYLGEKELLALFKA